MKIQKLMFTKKKILLISVVLIASSLVLSLVIWLRLPIMVLSKGENKPNMISYAYLLQQSESSNAMFSLNVANSDWGPNETLLSALTGTLVKYGHSGRIEPYLAQDFNVSTDSLKWQFNLKPNLYTQNDILIDAIFFKRCLENQLKLYSKSLKFFYIFYTKTINILLIYIINFKIKYLSLLLFVIH